MAGLAGGIYFAAAFTAGFVIGAPRTLWLAPAIGELGAVLLELPLMLLWSWMASRWLAARFLPPQALAPRLVMGGTAFLLLMIGEFGLWTAVFAQPATTYVARYCEPTVLLGFASQVAFALFPALQLIIKR